jgi:hypothetical protein
MRAFLLATSAGPRGRLMLPRGMLSGVECPVTSKYVASPASKGSCDFDRRESRTTVWKGASPSFHSTLAFSIQEPNCPGGAASCSPLMVVVALGEPGVPVVWIRVQAGDATAIKAAANIPLRRKCFVGFIECCGLLRELQPGATGTFWVSLGIPR